MATGTHSTVLIAASHHHTFTDHTNQTSLKDFIDFRKVEESLARYQSICTAKKTPSSIEAKLIFSILEWSTCNTAEEHGHSFAWLYLQRFPDVFTDDPCHILAPGN